MDRKAPKFEPHFNREMNKYYRSSKDYVSDMKAAGVEPYRGEIKRESPKPYVRSAWATEMYKDIKDRNGRKPGDRFIKELEKRGYTKERFEQARKIANKEA